MNTRIGHIADVVTDMPRIVTAPLFRSRHRHWGTKPAEQTAPMPGDDVLPAAQYRCTRAVTVRAEPARVWPWLGIRRRAEHAAGVA